VQSKDALGGITKNKYDLLGNVTQITDATNKLTQNNYDDLGRLISVTDSLIETPVDKVDSYTYDEAGNVLTYTNRLGQVTRSTYDTVNRLTKTEYLTDATSDNISYDSFGDAITISNNGVSYTMDYDVQHRMLDKLDSRQNKILSFGYNSIGLMLSKIDYQNNRTDYRYDSTNQLVSLTNPSFLTANYQQDAAGRLLTRTLSDGAQTSYTYDANGWVNTLVQKSANGTVLSNITYTRDRLGNILTQSENVANSTGANTGTTSYTYDALYRLKTADYPALVTGGVTGSATVNDEAFSYDAVGNRLTQTKGGLSIGAAGSSTRYYEYTANSNRLKAIHTGSLAGAIEKSYTYDDAGRMTAQTGTGAKTLTWNQQDHAKTINANSKVISYGYDPLSYRISSTGSSRGSQDYYLEGEHMEALYSNNLLQAQYLRGASTDELLAGWLQDSSNPANIPATATFSNTITGTPYIFHHDTQNSVSSISSHDGNMLQQASYSAFGNSLNQTGSAANNSNTNTLKYTGREQDADTGLYYYRARYYDTDIGRFISEDPKGFAAGINFYAYVGNNPVNANDPSGLDTKVTIGYTHTIAPGLSHQVVILTDTVTGSQYATRAGPECALCGGLGAGSITAVSDWYTPKFKDPPSSVYTTQEVGVIGRDFSDSVKNAINFRDTTNKNQIPYWPLGPNSNSYASTFVESLTGTRPVPNVVVPGADMGRPSPSLNYIPSPVINTGGATGSWGGSSGVSGGWNDSNTNVFNGNSFSFGGIDFIGNSAAGGYLLYPNKPNNNQMRAVYSK
jgi:RHS repeat-associated protein